MEKYNILYCHTSKHKLEESKYFFETLTHPDIWNDDEKFSFFMNAFIFSAGSVVHYVNADFIYNKIKPRIRWYEYEDRNKRSDIINNHPEKDAIENFRSKYANRLDTFLRKPVANYFRLKRNKITHIHWDAARWASFTEKDNVTTYDQRRFEGFASDYYKKTSGHIPLDLFDENICEKDKEETLDYLCREDIRKVCKEYLKLLQEFIEKFDGEKYPFISQNDFSSQDNN